MMSRLGLRTLAASLAVGLLGLIAVAGLVWRDDILQAFLDPKIPFAVYRPPPAPDYQATAAWARLPGALAPGDPPADVFFVAPTSFDGGRDWNGPITDRTSLRRLNQIILPNYAKPFAAAGRAFAPLYRQASLFASLSLFDDALEAREFAYGDIARAFDAFLADIGPDRPFIIVGVEQGGLLADRLLDERVARAKTMRGRLIGAYLVETIVPASAHAAGAILPACAERDEAGCILAWRSTSRLDFMDARRILDRSLVWRPDGRLTTLAGEEPLCVNPLIGAASDAEATARLNLGAANASGLEWGARPGFLVRQVSAQCVNGLLRVSHARSGSLHLSGGWSARLRAPPYNLFWADLEADSLTRERVWLAARDSAASPSRSTAPPDASQRALARP